MTKTAIAKPAAATADLPAPYQPNPAEQGAIEAIVKAQRQQPPRIKVQTKDGAVVLSIDHPNQNAGQAMLMQSMGASNPDFLIGLLAQLGNVGSKGKETSQEGLCYMLSMGTAEGQCVMMRGTKGPTRLASMTSLHPIDGGLAQGWPSMSYPEEFAGLPACRHGEVVAMRYPLTNWGLSNMFPFWLVPEERHELYTFAELLSLPWKILLYAAPPYMPCPAIADQLPTAVQL